MECKNEHFRHILLFYFRKEKKIAEAHKEIREVYGINCITERTCQNWFKKFHSGDFSLKMTNVLVDLLNDYLMIKSKL